MLPESNLLMKGFTEGMPALCFEDEELPGWHWEKFGGLIERLFGKEAGAWATEINYFSDLILGAIFSTVDPLSGFDQLKEHGVIPFAILAGSVARRWYRESDFTFGVSRIFQRFLTDEGNLVGLDDVGRQALIGLENGPYDLDIKVVADQERFTLTVEMLQRAIKVFLGMCSECSQTTADGVEEYSYYLVSSNGNPRDTAAVAMEVKDLPNSKKVIFLTLSKGKRTFNIQITNYPDELELARDYRLGHQFSQKQTIEVVLAQDLREDPDRETLIMETKKNWQYGQANWDKPESISNPEYENLTQALTAGLRMIRMVCMWPPAGKRQLVELVNWQTILDYRQSLMITYKKFLQNSNELDNYRVGEIIREAVLCATFNPVLFIRLATALGILNVFLPRLAFSGGMGDNDYRSLLRRSDRFSWAITSQFEGLSGDLYDFEPGYEARVQSGCLGLNEIGAVLIVKALQNLGGFIWEPANLATAVKIFDLREVKKRHQQSLLFIVLNAYTFGLGFWFRRQIGKRRTR